MKILLFGANGMLAHDISSQLNQHNIIKYDKSTCDISNPSQISQVLYQNQDTNIIINCAAYTAVDLAQGGGYLDCMNINSIGMYNLSKIANKYNIDIIHISSDYVFDGSQTNGYKPSDTPNPINNYGMSKYLGEQLSKDIYPSTIIIRTSRLYGGGPNYNNFVNTMIKLSHTKDEISVVSDQYGMPTYTVDLADAIGYMLDNLTAYRGQVLHLSNTSGDLDTVYISRADFATEVMYQTSSHTKIKYISTQEYPRPAPRPHYSLFINDSDIYMPNRKDGLNRYINRIR